MEDFIPIVESNVVLRQPVLLTFLSKQNLIPRVAVKRVVRNLGVKKVIQAQLLKWLMILIR